MKHFTRLTDFSGPELKQLVSKAIQMKQKERYGKSLDKKVLVMVFFNPSLRTRASFQVGMEELGGSAVCLDIGQGVWSMEWREGTVMNGQASEHLKEAVRVLARYGQILAVRSFPQLKSWDEDKTDPVLSAFVKYSTVPVINMESSLDHPCQGLGDMMTLTEKMGDLRGKKMSVVWANHPKVLPMAVPNAAVIAAAKFGMDVTLVCPKGYELDENILQAATQSASENGGCFSVNNDRAKGMEGTKVVYAKSWGSLSNYGNPEKELSGRAELSEWIVDGKLMSRTDDAFFMHCLPVRRNVVVTDEVIDSRNSIVIDQAENRLHAQKAILRDLLEV